MFDRKTYNRIYRRNQRAIRKAEGKCVTCGAQLNSADTTLQCEFCRKKQKYARCKKEEIRPMIAEARTNTAEAIRAALHANRSSRDGITFKLVDLETIDRVIDEVLKEH